jgi:hypothetical protein
MITLLVGLTFMTIGFVLRIILAGSPGSLGIYVITTLLLLLSVRISLKPSPSSAMISS